MRIQDQVLLALTAWRENRGGGRTGMQSVINVVCNRVAKDGTNAYEECVKREQFTSLTGRNDPELGLWPMDNDPQWLQALDLAQMAAAGVLVDITNGALLYYAPRSIVTTKTIPWLDGTQVAFPEGWNAAAVTPLCEICGQLFFR